MTMDPQQKDEWLAVWAHEQQIWVLVLGQEQAWSTSWAQRPLLPLEQSQQAWMLLVLHCHDSKRS
jgi:hypothetical protein